MQSMPSSSIEAGGAAAEARDFNKAPEKPMVLFESLRKVSGEPDEFSSVTDIFLSLAASLRDQILAKQAETIALMAHNGKLPLGHNRSVINPSTLASIVEFYMEVALASVRSGPQTAEHPDLAEGLLEDPSSMCSTTIDELGALMELATDNLAQDATATDYVALVTQRIHVLKTMHRQDPHMHHSWPLHAMEMVSAFRRCEDPATQKVDAGAGAHRPSKFAIVTLVTGGAWLQGALVLGHTLRRPLPETREGPAGTNVRPPFDMIAMCYEMIDEERELVELAGWRCISPAVIENPWSTSPWKWDYHLKIQPFNLTEYTRILVLDSDMVVLDVEGLTRGLFDEIELFPSTFIYAIPDCVSRSLNRSAQAELNGGLLLLTPGYDVFETLVGLAPSTPSIDTGGQGFFSSVFKGRIRWLPEQFNYLRHTLCVLDFDQKNFPGDASALASPTPIDPMNSKDPRWADLVQKHLPSVVVLHFHFKPKPWECTKDRIFDCGNELGGGTSNILTLNELWFEKEESAVAEFSNVSAWKQYSQSLVTTDIYDALSRSRHLLFQGDVVTAYREVYRVGSILLDDEYAEGEGLSTVVLNWLADNTEDGFVDVATLLLLKEEHPEISELELHREFLKSMYELGLLNAAEAFSRASQNRFSLRSAVAEQTQNQNPEKAES